MTRMKATDFPQELLDIYDGYAHGVITKREFLERAQKYAVGGVTALALLKMLQPSYALANQVAPDDERIVSERISYPSPEGHGSVDALLVRPAGATGKLPGVLVVHENRGLNPYIEDVARRVAVAGFVALAPDGLTPAGGYPGSDDAGREMQAKLDPARLMEDFFAAYEFLLAHEATTDKVGCVGFCYGGGVCNALAVAHPTQRALLRPAGAGGGRRADRGAAATPLRRARHPHQRGLAGLRGGAERRRQDLRGSLLSGRQPRLPQRHDAAL